MLGSASAFPRVHPETPRMMRSVTVDVGGVVYKSTAQTLCKSPTLAALLARDSDSLFVDRDGEPFRVVLSFLRTDELLDKKPENAEALLCEARYYDLPDLVETLEAYLAPKPRRPWWARARDLFFDHYGKAIVAIAARFLFKQLKRGAKTITLTTKNNKSFAAASTNTISSSSRSSASSFSSSNYK